MTNWLTLANLTQAVAGSMSLLSIYNMGNKVLAGPRFGFASATAWAVMSLLNETWVLLACTCIAAGLHTFNYVKWRREAR